MLGIHWARGFKPNARAANDARIGTARTRNVNMTYHGGKIMTTAVTKDIFWGTSWGSYSGDKITGMDTWYIGSEGSNYSATSDEYTGTNGQVGASTKHLGHIIDTSASAGGGSTPQSWRKCAEPLVPPIRAAMVITPFTPTRHVAMPTIAPGTAMEPAAELPFSLLTSSSWTATQAATQTIRLDCTPRVWQQSPMSAGMNSLKHEQTPLVLAPGTTAEALKMETNALGPSAPHW